MRRLVRTWLKNPLAIYTGTPHDAGGGVVVTDGIVEQLVPSGGMPDSEVDRTEDVSPYVIVPGLVNCHHHFYQTLTRAFPAALDKSLFDWLTALYPVWAHLDEDSIRLSTRLALAELMLSGCTLANDHHYVFTDALNDAIDIQVDEAKRLGIRVTLTRGSMSLGQSKGGLPPDHVVQTEAEILADSERLIATHHDASPGAMTQIALAPCSPFSVTAALMRDSAALARQHGVLLHTHLAETEDENDFCLQQVGMRPLDYLESVDWLADDVWFAHGIHFNDDEIARLGAAGSAISHCPSSNQVLASGICRVNELEHAGCAVGLGVDGSASNDCSNMIGEARQAMLLQRLRYGANDVSHLDALRWATAGGAGVLHRPDVGTLAVGQTADLGCYALDELRFSGHGDPIAALLLCGAHQVHHLMIAGEWRVRERCLVDVDQQALIAEHSSAAVALARRAIG
ncbi:MAG: 8-oxoguanine deaminase [Pseudomonadota bacterium]